MNHPTRYFFPRVLYLILALALLTTIVRAQQPAAGAVTVKDFAGTWHWMFAGKPFATMVLEPKADSVTGSITGASLETDDQGRITNAIASSGTCTILRSSLENGVLHIVCKADDDEIEWAVKLISPIKAEVVASGADAPKMEPIRAEKVQ